jgi:hypothetical protein
MDKQLIIDMKFTRVVIFILLIVVCLHPVKILGFISIPGSSTQSMPFNIQRSYPDIKKDIVPPVDQNIGEREQSSLNKESKQTVAPDYNKTENTKSLLKTPVLSWTILLFVLLIMIIFLASIRFFEKKRDKTKKIGRQARPK